MQFKDVIGNSDLKERLINMVQNGRVGHSIMFVEQDGCGALPMALAFIQYLACRNKVSDGDSCGECPVCKKISKGMHPDVHIVFPVNATSKSGSDKKPVSDHFLAQWRELVEENPYFLEKELYQKIKIEDKVGVISVAEAKEVLSKLSLKSYEGYNKYMLIYLPERMNTEAANRLLKIVEEPSEGTYFIFVSHSPENVLGTIRSRSQVVRVHPVEASVLSPYLQRKYSLNEQEAMSFARASNGSVGEAIAAVASVTDGVQYLSEAVAMFEAASHKNLLQLLKNNDAIVEMGREKQKGFCIYAQELLRKILMLQKGIPQISNATPTELPHIERLSKEVNQESIPLWVSALERTREAVEGNVNAKIAFCNLANYLYMG